MKAGQQVTFNGAFTNHPLQPAGGTTPTPIVATSTGTTNAFTFPTVGTYGYDCQFHPGLMLGAIYVKAN